MDTIYFWVKHDLQIWKKMLFIKDKTEQIILLKNIETQSEDLIVEYNREDILLCSGEYCENLIHLIYLNEAEILNTIHIGYNQDSIYTLNDSILIAVNPYKNIDIYSNEIINRYYKKETHKPHPYLIANNAFKKLLHFKRNQTILVSGESGAGKTQTTKYLMKYISKISDYKIKNNIEKELIAPNIILEAFGNAKTIRNDNSSRFGKFIKLQFNIDFQLVGANINTYLLEKIRVTNTNNNENNFHIFYILLNGLSSTDRLKYKLENPSAYHYLHFDNSNHMDFDKHYRELLDAFSLLHFTDMDVVNIIKIISFILNVGNIRTLDDKEYIYNCIQLFDLDEGMFIDLFEYRYLDVHTEKIQIKNTENEFATIRDTLAQILYKSLFEFIVSKINKCMDKESSYFIGILDIFGFEVFDNNGFEQLCINYTNEKLQNIFNKYIFEQQQKEYIKEKIQWEHIKYPDNKQILNLIENKNGFFSIIEEQCILKSGNDKQLYSRLIKLMNDNDTIYVGDGDKVDHKLSILHYAGNVKYTIDDFIHKNKNNADDRIFELLGKLDMNIEIIKPNNNDSILKQFRIQLTHLLNVIEHTDQHYIRCIKPNDKNQNNAFNRNRVYEQLTYCGVLEAVKIVRLGYSIQVDLLSFIDEFYPLIIKQNIIVDVKHINEFMEHTIELDDYTDSTLVYQIGVSKLFLKRNIYEQLIYKNKCVMTNNAIYIQKYARQWIHYIRYTKLRKSIIYIQFKWRDMLVKKKKSMVIISNMVNSYICRKKYMNIRKSIYMIQKCIRRYIVKKQRIILYSIICIQSNWRMVQCKQKYITYKKKINYILKIQRQFRVYKNRKIMFIKLKETLHRENIYTTKMSNLENILIDKNKYIEMLLMENEGLKEALKKGHTISYNETKIKLDYGHEIATKMEHLYLKLSIAEAELLKIKNERDAYRRQQQPGLIRSIKSILFD